MNAPNLLTSLCDTSYEQRCYGSKNLNYHEFLSHARILILCIPFSNNGKLNALTGDQYLARLELPVCSRLVVVSPILMFVDCSL